MIHTSDAIDIRFIQYITRCWFSPPRGPHSFVLRLLPWSSSLLMETIYLSCYVAIFYALDLFPLFLDVEW